MGPRLLRSFLILLLLGATAGVSAADLSKLDPLARAALARLRAGAVVSRMLENHMAVNPEGELDVFIRGPVSRAELEAAGAKVRSALRAPPG